MPTNSTASRMAMAVSVVAAFFDSGGLKAGTPLAIASVPVRATEPLAKARSSRKIVSGCGDRSALPGMTSGGGAPWCSTATR